MGQVENKIQQNIRLCFCLECLEVSVCGIAPYRRGRFYPLLFLPKGNNQSNENIDLQSLHAVHISIRMV